MPYPYISSDIIFGGAPSPLTNQYGESPSSTNPRELFQFVHNLSIYVIFPEANNFEYSIISGKLPESLALNTTTGIISGTVDELDRWVPGWVNKPPIKVDGSNYATAGSAKEGYYVSEFTVRVHVDDAPDNELFADMPCTIEVINNWSSDRDQLIRDYTAQFGRTFAIDGKLVDAEAYITYQKSRGNYPILSSSAGFISANN